MVCNAKAYLQDNLGNKMCWHNRLALMAMRLTLLSQEQEDFTVRRRMSIRVAKLLAGSSGHHP
jgi:hypothetical protein